MTTPGIDEAATRTLAAMAKLAKVGDDDALEVLAMVAERLAKGFEVYGKMDRETSVDGKGVDWEHEWLEEACDAQSYAAKALMRLRRLRAKGEGQ